MLRVAIVGRPNVGKSTLFNALRDVAGAQRSGVRWRRARAPAARITSPVARTTRDAATAPARLGSLRFEVVDTAGVERDSVDVDGQRGAHAGLAAAMRARTAECVRRADVALLLLDGAVGATGDDDAVGRWLRRRAGDVPRVVAFNKCEDGRDVSGADREVAARHADVGPLLVSATHGDGLPDLLDALRGFGATAGIDADVDDGDAASAVRVALVGRPNARGRARRLFFASRPRRRRRRGAVRVPAGGQVDAAQRARAIRRGDDGARGRRDARRRRGPRDGAGPRGDGR